MKHHLTQLLGVSAVLFVLAFFLDPRGVAIVVQRYML